MLSPFSVAMASMSGLPRTLFAKMESSVAAPLLVTGRRVPARLPRSLKALSTGRLMPLVARAR
jgi:hypothetical protein